MGLRARVALMLAAAMLSMLGIALVARHTLTLPELLETEAVADRLNVRRLELGFYLMRKRAEEWIYDYAVWDDTFDFVLDRNPDYVASNLLLKTLVAPRFNGIWVFDNANRSIARIEADLATETLRETPRLGLADAAALLPVAVPGDRDKPVIVSGIARTAAGPLLYAAGSIKKANERGDSPGRMLVYRFLDEALFEQLRTNLQVSFTADALGAGTQLEPGESPDVAHRDSHDRIYWTLLAQDGMPIYRFALQLPRSTVDRSFMSTTLWIISALVALIFAIIMLLLDRQVLRPVGNIVTHLQRIRREGDYGLRLDAPGNDEIATLGRECDTLIAFVQEQQERLAAQARELRDLSNHDALTGLANRRLFDVVLQDYWHLATRHGTPLTLLLCDVDYFKNYNDRLGHQAGDEVLTRFGAILRSALVRQSDLCCRYGGEEFALLLPNTGAEGGKEVAARIHAALRDAGIPHPDSRAGQCVTVSVGVATFDPAADRELAQQQLIANADRALYACKASGRNGTMSFGAI
jgi:diguanylate cyclase (GGDEF)-like protein